MDRLARKVVICEEQVSMPVKLNVKVSRDEFGKR